ncbi:MAG: hypothetical protein AB7V55_01435 [Oscillospiraceae bacterium]
MDTFVFVISETDRILRTTPDVKQIGSQYDHNAQKVEFVRPKGREGDELVLYIQAPGGMLQCRESLGQGNQLLISRVFTQWTKLEIQVAFVRDDEETEHSNVVGLLFRPSIDASEASPPPWPDPVGQLAGNAWYGEPEDKGDYLSILNMVGDEIVQLHNTGGYTLPQATSTALGGIKADAIQSGDTQPVRIDEATGKLYTSPTYCPEPGDTPVEIYVTDGVGWVTETPAAEPKAAVVEIEVPGDMTGGILTATGKNLFMEVDDSISTNNVNITIRDGVISAVGRPSATFRVKYTFKLETANELDPEWLNQRLPYANKGLYFSVCNYQQSPSAAPTYLLSNDGRDAYKIQLGRGVNIFEMGSGAATADGAYNGTYRVVEAYRQHAPYEVVQDCQFVDGVLYMGLGHAGYVLGAARPSSDVAAGVFRMDYEVWKDTVYLGDGTEPSAHVQGVAFKDGTLYCGTSTGQLRLYGV